MADQKRYKIKSVTGSDPSMPPRKRGRPRKNPVEEPKPEPKNEHMFAFQILPFILVVVAVVLEIFFLASDSGVVGNAIKTGFFAMFGVMSYAFPAVIVYSAIILGMGKKHSNFVSKIIYSIIVFILITMLIHVFVGTMTLSAKELIAEGMESGGGGLIGGGLASLFLMGFKKTASIIILIASIIILLLLMAGLTPRQFARMAGEKVNDARDHVSEKKAHVDPEKDESIEVIGDEDYDNGINVDLTGTSRGSKIDSLATDNGSIGEPEPLTKREIKVSDMNIDISGIVRNDDIAEEDHKKIDNDLYSEEPVDNADGTDLRKIFVDPDDADDFFSGDDWDEKKAGKDINSSAEVEIAVDKGEAEPVEVISSGQDDTSEEKREIPNDKFDAGKDYRVEQITMPVPKKEYRFPPIRLLVKQQASSVGNIKNELKITGEKLVSTLATYKVNVRITGISRGPSTTRFEVMPEQGVRVSSINNLSDDIALNLAASGGVRIEAPIPGKMAVGIEIPNRKRETVQIRPLIEDPKFKENRSKLNVVLGMNVAGEPVYCDIAKMPHLLIAGTTGSGKSVCLNCMLISILYKADPDEVKLILIDPKKVEMNMYNGLPHLIVPVVSDPKKAAGALAWAVGEMERRYLLIEEAGVRDLASYNEATADDPEKEHLPLIVIVIDEMADLMMTAAKEVENSICRLAQKARAAGIHVVMATQRPSVDVVTGLIKANFPSRIALTVANQVDSRTILDGSGAEKLLGRGDMLYSPIGLMKPERVQGAWVSDEEVEDVITFIKDKNETEDEVYDNNVIREIEHSAEMVGEKKNSASGFDSDPAHSEEDPLFAQAVEVAIESKKISTSLLQRRLSIGYGRAAKLIDLMQARGFVTPPDGNKPRDVRITQEEYQELVLRGNNLDNI